MKIKEAMSRLFPAMKLRNYRLFFIGQLISWSGNWLQIAIIGWQVKKEFNGTAEQVGFISALPQLIAAVLSIFGGAFTDRFNTKLKGLIYTTQGIQMLLAFVLGCLTLTHHSSILCIEILSVILGITNALDRPTTHSFIAQIAGANIRSAVALNGSLILAGAAIGGLLAAVLIPLVGIGGAYIVNGISFIAIFWTMALIKVPKQEKKDLENGKKKPESPLLAMKTAWKYLWHEKIILYHILMNGLVVIVGFSCRAIFPVITVEMFHGGSKVNGYLFAAFGIGSLLAAIAVSAFEDELKKEGSLFKRFVIGGPMLAGVALVLFAMDGSVVLCAMLVAMAGAGVVFSSSTLRGSIQEHTVGPMRGRVMGLVMAIFLGSMALGQWLIGILATHVGPVRAVVITGVASLVSAAFMYAAKNKVLVSGRVAPVHK